MTEGLRGQGVLNDSPQPIHRFIEKEALTEAAREAAKTMDDSHGMVTLFAVTEAALKQKQLSSQDIADAREKLTALSGAREKAVQEIDAKSREGNQKIPLGKATEILVYYRPGWSGYLIKSHDTSRKIVPAVFSVFLSTDAGYVVPLASLNASPLVVTDLENKDGLEEREGEVRRKIQEQMKKVRDTYGSYVLGKDIVTRNNGYSTRNIIGLNRGEIPSWKAYNEIRKTK